MAIPFVTSQLPHHILQLDTLSYPNLDTSTRAKTMPDESQHWNHVLRTMVIHDEKMVANWKDELSNLLIFAGLFSAVVTAFNVEAYQWLEQEPEDRIAEVLNRISLQLSNPTVDAFDNKHTLSDHSSNADVVINALWFSSLTLGLVASLFAIIAQQWIRNYTDHPLGSENAERACLRQQRFNALKKWNVPEIIVGISVLLQVALFIFFAGMLSLLWKIHTQVALAVTTVLTILLLFFLLTTVLPTFASDCPYRSPLSWAFNCLARLLALLAILPLQIGSSKAKGFLDAAINSHNNISSSPLLTTLHHTISRVVACFTAWERKISVRNSSSHQPWVVLNSRGAQIEVVDHREYMRSALLWTSDVSSIFTTDLHAPCVLKYTLAEDATYLWLADISRRSCLAIRKEIRNVVTQVQNPSLNGSAIGRLGEQDISIINLFILRALAEFIEGDITKFEDPCDPEELGGPEVSLEASTSINVHATSGSSTSPTDARSKLPTTGNTVSTTGVLATTGMNMASIIAPAHDHEAYCVLDPVVRVDNLNEATGLPDEVMNTLDRLNKAPLSDHLHYYNNGQGLTTTAINDEVFGPSFNSSIGKAPPATVTKASDEGMKRRINDLAEKRHDLTTLVIWVIHWKSLSISQVQTEYTAFLSRQIRELNVLESNLALVLVENLVSISQAPTNVTSSHIAQICLEQVKHEKWFTTLLRLLSNQTLGGSILQRFELISLAMLELNLGNAVPIEGKIGPHRRNATYNDFIAEFLTNFKVHTSYQRYWFHTFERLLSGKVTGNRTVYRTAEDHRAIQAMVNAYFRSAFPRTTLRKIYVAIDGRLTEESSSHGNLKTYLKNTLRSGKSNKSARQRLDKSDVEAQDRANLTDTQA